MVVASLTAVTAGILYSREMTAPWDSIPPVSVIRPPTFENTAVQAGSVLLVIRISLSSSFDNSSMDSTTLAMPLKVPGLAAAP